MKTATNTTTHTERHIINGSANLLYSYTDVMKLDEKSRLAWFWFAIVGTGANITYKELLAASDLELIYERIQDANFDKESKKIFAEPALNLNGFKTNSPAQIQTLLAYGDSDSGEKYGINCRQLTFITECNDLNDMLSCARLVSSYNEFSSANIYAGSEYLRKAVFYNDSNPNNNRELLKFSFGRESSPVIYVKYSFYNNPYTYIVNRDGAKVTAAPYTVDLFKSDMQAAANIFKCDEFNIEETEHAFGSYKCFTARFWFD